MVVHVLNACSIESVIQSTEMHYVLIIYLKELEAIKARVKEMEEEAEKLKDMQKEIEGSLNLSMSPTNAGKN